MNETVINAGIIVAYILVGLAALAAVVGPVIQLLAHFKKAVPALVGILVLVAVLFLGYSLSTNEAYDTVGPVASQWIGGGIKSTMILIGMALVAAVYTEVAKFFK